MKKLTPFTLSPSDEQLAFSFSDGMAERLTADGLRNLRVGAMTDMECNLMGYGAEIAVARLFGVTPCLRHSAAEFMKGASPSCGDFVFRGFRVDVKAVSKLSHRLILREDRRGYADLYVLVCVGDWPRMVFLGCMWAADLERPGRLARLRPSGPLNFTARPEELSDLPWSLPAVNSGIPLDPGRPPVYNHTVSTTLPYPRPVPRFAET